MPKEGGGVNDYMEVIVKDTVTLHKVLSRYLAGSVVEVGSAYVIRVHRVEMSMCSS